jgi:hypothetical protein
LIDTRKKNKKHTIPPISFVYGRQIRGGGENWRSSSVGGDDLIVVWWMKRRFTVILLQFTSHTKKQILSTPKD